MTLEEFDNLFVDDQVTMIENRGVLIGEREESHHRFLLFQIDAFYTEVALRKKDDTIWKVGCFDHPILLEPYLNRIDLSEITRL
ncbi:hypothetical protein [Flavisolibacter ginsenosidimutans]|uniref:Uncharacterized protein n=1 Tax=Flavisolibacter ginsenosidimutans TaxID=661481 RepID=A0A5B8UIW8_9BACT|nr:hypothetical protein [Flavisolibacter ginsenosidimutans]QEC56624.1 hypothetical protein FSB75_12210 [Flavisolibacter ginsenosidimutans]